MTILIVLVVVLLLLAVFGRNTSTLRGYGWYPSGVLGILLVVLLVLLLTGVLR